MHGMDTEDPAAGEVLRRPSAVETLAVDASSRKRFFKAVGGTAAAGLFAAVLAACGEEPPAEKTPGGSDPNTAAGVGTDQFGEGDAGIAAFALTLEMVEVDFYKAANGSGNLKGRAAELAKQFGAQEQQHEKALTDVINQLGGHVPARPKASFSTDSQAAILQQAADLEGLGAAALLGQAGRIQDKKFLAVALTMHSVEGRHAAAIHELLRADNPKEDPAPEGAFAKPVFAADVITQLHSLTQPG
jgi:rubrerythrin